MGRMLALALAKQGHQIELFDRGDATAQQSAARIAAAMLAPLAESAITEANVVRMGIHSLPRWQEIIADLSTPVYFQQNGTLVLWHRQDASDAERFVAHLDKYSANNNRLTAAQKLDAQQLSLIEPAVSDRFTQGLYLPNEGQLDNRQLLDALLLEINHLGVQCHWSTAIDPEELRLNQGYDWVIDCRGLGAQSAWLNAEFPANPLRGVRGEVIRLYAPEVKLQRPTRLIHPRYPIYIAPKEHDIYVVGATEIESNDLSDMSVRSALELLSAVYTVHSGFAEARILEMAAQCRPTLKDNLPEIRLLKDQGSAALMQINGLYRHGFMICPAVLDCALELLMTDRSQTAADLDLCVRTNNHQQEVDLCA